MKKILLMLIAIVLMFMMVGCSSSNHEGSSTNANLSNGNVAHSDVDNNEPITITYWHSHSNAQLEGLDYMIAEFNKVYPHITVEPVYQGGYGDLHKKVLAGLAANDVPSVTNIESASLAQFAESGVFADLGPFMASSGTDIDDFSKGMLNAYSYQGKQYALPLIVSASVFIYNKDLLDENGVEAPRTWDDIPAFAEALTVKNGSEVERYAFSVPGWSSWYYDPWIINGGGEIITADNKSGLDQEATMKFLKKFKEWKNNGWLHIGYGSGASDTMRQMFYDGKIAMVEHTSAFIKSYIENADFEVGVAFLPKDEKQITHIGGAGIAILENIDQAEKEAAWKFVEFMTSVEHNIKWAEYTGYLPTRKSAKDTEDGQEYFGKWPQYNAVMTYFDNVESRIQHPAYGEFRKFYEEAVGKVALEDAEVEPLMIEAAKKMNDVLKEYE